MTDAEWYFREDPERDQYNKFFFQFCRQFNVRWMTATPKERAFIEEITRITYEKDRARRLGLPLSDVRPFFAPV